MALPACIRECTYVSTEILQSLVTMKSQMPLVVANPYTVCIIKT